MMTDGTACLTNYTKQKHVTVLQNC